MVSETPDIRVEEVDRIVRELKSKKYKIDFEKVAEGFIKEAILNEISRRPRGK
jgi:anti-sigma28 factor (negative regulator of flagellin synthesis)